jgi:sarcosine oxidase subunit beta
MKKQKIIIIGAGSTGLSTALEIAKANTKNDKEIIVLDKGYVGSGQTGQCCGFVRTFYNVPEMIFSAHYSMQEIKKIAEQEPDLEYTTMGLLVFDQLKNKKGIQENVSLLKSHGVRASYLEESEINKLNPYVNTDNTCAGFDENAGYINPQLIINYLERECKKYGVTIFEQTKVESITRKDGQFHITTQNDTFVADKLFNATAGYTNNINEMLDFNLPVKTIKINNTFYRLPLGPSEYLVAMADFVNCFYIIPHKDFVDVSAMTLDLKRIIDLEKQETSFDPETVHEYLSLISHRIKGVEKASTLGGFGSHLDITPDYYPILSHIDEIPNYYCATGFSGTGFKHFPMIGKIMREQILEETYTYPELISFFRYDRFKQENLRENVRDSYFVKE